MPRGGKREGAGRPAGVPNKITSDLKGMILGALEAVGGQDYLAKQAVESPAAFLTLIGKVLPAQLTADVTLRRTLIEMTDDELLMLAAPDRMHDAAEDDMMTH
jgi:hypothetical protein